MQLESFRVPRTTVGIDHCPEDAESPVLTAYEPRYDPGAPREVLPPEVAEADAFVCFLSFVLEAA